MKAAQFTQIRLDKLVQSRSIPPSMPCLTRGPQALFACIFLMALAACGGSSSTGGKEAARIQGVAGVQGAVQAVVEGLAVVQRRSFWQSLRRTLWLVFLRA